MGSTVDDPEMLSDPDTAPPVVPVVPVPPPSSSPPQAAATSDNDAAAASSTSHFLRFRIQLLLRRPIGTVVAGTLPTPGERPQARA
jgi:hypothetical protein